MRTNYVLGLCAVVALQAGAMAQTVWTQVASTGPSARQRHAMAYDSQRGLTVLFGGGPPPNSTTNETWEWDGNTWMPRGAGPGARTDAAMAYDSQRGRYVLFGGSAGVFTFGDTWEWNGSWVQVANTGPSSRTGHRMVYDSQRGRTVLFGGYSGSLYLGDTWEWTGTAWLQVASAGPGLRKWHAMAYDNQRGRTVLFGGEDGFAPLADTWEWSGSVWQPMLFASGPSARSQHSMAYDTQRGRTLLFGGQYGVPETWEWDGTNWVLLAALGPTLIDIGTAMAYDSQRGRAILVGTAGDTWELLSGQHASSASPFGAGCGAPTLALSPVATGRPSINTTAQASITNSPSSFAFVALGWSRTTFGPFALPLPLAGYGMPGCELLQSSEFNVPAVMTGPGTAAYSLPLPNWSGLIGLHIYLQGWAVAPGVNPGNTIVSNGLEWVIGY